MSARVLVGVIFTSVWAADVLVAAVATGAAAASGNSTGAAAASGNGTGAAAGGVQWAPPSAEKIHAEQLNAGFRCACGTPSICFGGWLTAPL